MIGRIVRAMQKRANWLHHYLSVGDRFANVWNDRSRTRQQALLREIVDVANGLDQKLFLFWGTLLGQVREGQILCWDDDVDLALFDADPASVDRLIAALEASGLRCCVINPGERIIKIFDPAYDNLPGFPWTWPFVDLFAYGPADKDCAPLEPAPIAMDIVMPGRKVPFENAVLWQVEEPLEVLDRLYPDWRTTERSPTWNHRTEQPLRAPASRRIETGPDGRKRVRAGASV